MWEDEERTRDVSNIVKDLIPPVGMRTSYYPGEGGFAERDLTQPAGTGGPVSNATIDINAPGGAQSRLAQLESNTPYGPTGVSTSGYGSLDLGGRSYSMSPAAIAEAVNAGTGGGPSVSGTSMGAPKYGIPDELMMRFDDAIKAITGPSEESNILKMQAQGYGLGLGGRRIPGHGYEPNPQLEAGKALAQIDSLKRQAASHLANTLSGLMMNPNKFAQDIYDTQMKVATESERNRLLGRKTAVEEALMPFQAREMAGKAPATVAGYGPGGEHILSGWDPDKQAWTTISKGAVPIGVPEGGKLINPITGEEVGQGNEKSQNKARLAAISWKAYEDENKAIEKDINLQGTDEPTVKLKQERQAQAWSRLSDSMTRLGYGDMFKATGGGTNAIQTRKPNETIDEYLKRAGL